MRKCSTPFTQLSFTLFSFLVLTLSFHSELLAKVKFSKDSGKWADIDDVFTDADYKINVQGKRAFVWTGSTVSAKVFFTFGIGDSGDYKESKYYHEIHAKNEAKDPEFVAFLSRTPLVLYQLILFKPDDQDAIFARDKALRCYIYTGDEDRLLDESPYRILRNFYHLKKCPSFSKAEYKVATSSSPSSVYFYKHMKWSDWKEIKRLRLFKLKAFKHTVGAETLKADKELGFAALPLSERFSLVLGRDDIRDKINWTRRLFQAGKHKEALNNFRQLMTKMPGGEGSALVKVKDNVHQGYRLFILNMFDEIFKKHKKLMPWYIRTYSKEAAKLLNATFENIKDTDQLARRLNVDLPLYAYTTYLGEVCLWLSKYYMRRRYLQPIQRIKKMTEDWFLKSDPKYKKFLQLASKKNDELIKQAIKDGELKRSNVKTFKKFNYTFSSDDKFLVSYDCNNVQCRAVSAEALAKDIQSYETSHDRAFKYTVAEAVFNSNPVQTASGFVSLLLISWKKEQRKSYYLTSFNHRGELLWATYLGHVKGEVAYMPKGKLVNYGDLIFVKSMSGGTAVALPGGGPKGTVTRSNLLFSCLYDLNVDPSDPPEIVTWTQIKRILNDAAHTQVTSGKTTLTAEFETLSKTFREQNQALKYKIISRSGTRSSFGISINSYDRIFRFNIRFLSQRLPQVKFYVNIDNYNHALGSYDFARSSNSNFLIQQDNEWNVAFLQDDMNDERADARFHMLITTPIVPKNIVLSLRGYFWQTFGGVPVVYHKRDVYGRGVVFNEKGGVIGTFDAYSEGGWGSETEAEEDEN